MNSERAAHWKLDARRDRRLLVTASLVTGGIFAIGASFQSVFVMEKDPLIVAGHDLGPVPDFLLRLAINLTAVLIIAWGPALTRVMERPVFIAFAISLGIAVSAALVRGVLQFAFGVHPRHDLMPFVGDGTSAVIVSLFVIATAVMVTEPRQRARAAERERQAAAVRAAEALNDLQQEELRVRRDVADTLHGTMQQQLVLIRATLNDVADGVRAAATVPRREALADDLASRILDARDQLDHLRENELRTLSATLYPEALDRGLVPALRALTARIPASIAVRFDVTNFPTPDALNQEERLLLVRVAEEGISNALRHGDANAIEVHLCHDDERVALSVRNFGVPPDDGAQLSGLARFRNRLRDRGGLLELHTETDGATLRATLPAPV